MVFQLTHPDLPVDFPRLLAGDGIAGNLPRQLTSFVGHEHDLVVIPDVLANAPVVTLTGVGGVGKTRLALEVAARVEPRYRDGAWLCKLEGVRHGDAVPDAVLEVFGVDPGQGGNAVATLIRFLRSKHLVLVRSEVKILATSRGSVSPASAGRSPAGPSQLRRPRSRGCAREPHMSSVRIPMDPHGVPIVPPGVRRLVQMTW